METRGTASGFSHDLRAPLRRRIVRAAGEIAFLEPDVAKHPFDDGNVLRLSTMRRAGDRELLVAPAERIKSARAEKWNYLKRFGAGAPVGERVGIVGGTEQLVAFSHHCRVHTMLGLGALAAGYSNVKFMRSHSGHMQWLSRQRGKSGRRELTTDIYASHCSHPFCCRFQPSLARCQFRIA